MYKVISDLKLKVQGVVKVFLAGNVIKLPEEAAKKFIQQGKIEPSFMPVDNLGERLAIMGENTAPEEIKPYVTNFGVLVIPWNSDPRFHYWRPGGQSLCKTLRELGRCDLIPKYRSIYN